MHSDFTTLACAPESVLDDDQLALLPEDSAPAPWSLRASTLIWTGHPDARAKAAIAEIVPSEISRDAVPVRTVGAFIHYLDTPVGSYSEIIGLVVYRRGASLFGHVPFIAVDSPVSVVGGRTNWALPKTLATFEGKPADRVPMSVTGRGWRVEATARAARLPIPTVSPGLLPMVQLGPDGALWTARPSGYGLIRPARIDVRVDSNRTDVSLKDWFPTGARRGILGAQMRSSFSAPG
ncbi:acetoacetate decarboxylase family protein [Pseudonocardia spinosispora]|uniref:acetoacetate decarboxylase family protein n=1 Tax=Pseudonocardia spinosispora TaxID=103441 RepID=UPI00040E4511|nr:acetoacetate decarboxylase family protein [Pseudonocardia spinosispora]